MHKEKNKKISNSDKISCFSKFKRGGGLKISLVYCEKGWIGKIWFWNYIKRD